MKIIHRNDAIHTSNTRDSALRRLGLANRWLIAGTAILTGVLTDVAANAFPGHAKAGTPSRRSKGHEASTATRPQPPAQPPRTTSTQEAAPPASSETAPPAESQASPEPTVQAPREAAPEAHTEAPPAEAPAPASRAAAPEREPSEPVVSGGS